MLFLFVSICLVAYILLKNNSASGTIQSFEFDDLQFEYASVTNNDSVLYTSEVYDMQISVYEEDISVMFDKNDSNYIVVKNSELIRIFINGTKVVSCDFVDSDCTGELTGLEEDIIILVNLFIR